MSFVMRSTCPFISEPKFPPVVFLLQCTCTSPSCPLADPTPNRLGFLNLILARSDGVCIFLSNYLSHLTPLVQVPLTFSLARSSLSTHASLLVCKDEVQQSISLHWHLDCLCQEVIIIALQTQCIVPPADLRVIQGPHENNMACECEGLSSCLEEASSTSS